MLYSISGEVSAYHGKGYGELSRIKNPISARKPDSDFKLFVSGGLVDIFIE
jgi:hypothetical protein